MQKLIRVKGPARIAELGRSVEKASRERDIKETDLVPKRIRRSAPKKSKAKAAPILQVVPDPEPTPAPVVQAAPPQPVAPTPAPIPTPQPVAPAPVVQQVVEGLTAAERDNLQTALIRLKALRAQWIAFIEAAPKTEASA